MQLRDGKRLDGFRARLDLTDNEIAVVLSGGQLSFLKKQLAAEREK